MLDDVRANALACLAVAQLADGHDADAWATLELAVEADQDNTLGQLLCSATLWGQGRAAVRYMLDSLDFTPGELADVD